MSLSNTSSNISEKGIDDEDKDMLPSTKLSNNLVVRVNQDSDDNLQALFDSVLNPGDAKRPLQVPFRMRKLPSSFFNQPAPSHSRANSADSSYDAGSQSNINKTVRAGPSPSVEVQQSPQQPISQNQSSLNRLTIHHFRARSSPASLQQNYNVRSRSETNVAGNQAPSFPENSVEFPSTGTANNLELDGMNTCVGQDVLISAQAIHKKQRSYDVISPIQLQTQFGALPPGWEQAKTNDGQIYYLNHTTKSTQWEDPRIQHQQRVIADRIKQNDNLGPLPDGWEQAVTDSGDIYFINHIDRTTSWNDPRIQAGLTVLDCPDNLVSSLQIEDNICSPMFNDAQNILNTPSAHKPDDLKWYKINN